jgi:hypothetical protein
MRVARSTGLTRGRLTLIRNGIRQELEVVIFSSGKSIALLIDHLKRKIDAFGD